MRDDNCIFCKIANGEIPSATLYEDEDFRVILDLGPASKGHALILPKQHFKDLCELDPAIAAKALPLAGKIGAAMKKALVSMWFRTMAYPQDRLFFISMYTLFRDMKMDRIW